MHPVQHVWNVRLTCIPCNAGANFKCIHLFPENGPLVSETVTNGVLVRASLIAEVESSIPRGYVFSYCIRFGHSLAQVCYTATEQLLFGVYSF